MPDPKLAAWRDQATIDAEQLAAEQERQDELLRKAAEAKVVEITTKRLILDQELSNEERQGMIGIYPRWVENEQVVVGVMRRHEEALYECIQSHTTQAGWEPPATAALWNSIVAPGTVGAWVQPAGAHDAYALGALVTHNGQTWISNVADNVWEPGVFGWDVYTG